MSIANSKISIFCDFDGTIALCDLGDEVFKKFSVFEPYNSQLKAKEITIKEYWKILCNNIQKDTSISDLQNFANTFEIDANFVRFLEYVNSSDYDFYVLSDGFDVYINALLEKYNISNLKIYCNKLEKLITNEFVPIYTNASESCNCFSASCKKSILLKKARPDDIVVYIGDGYSDFCPAEHSDIIFAKSNLTKYCEQNRIPHHHFKNFFDVQYILTGLKEKNRLKRRHQAFLKREKSFIYE